LSYSINGGSTWVQIQQWTGAATSNPASFNQAISAVAGQSNVKFKWNYTGTWGYYWDVDNIVISGEPVGPSYTWLSLNGQPSVSGTVTPSNNVNIPVNFNAAGLALGTYQAQINVTTNDPNHASTQIPVTMTVEQGGTPAISVSPTGLSFGNVTVNTTSNQTFTITNTGTATLSGSITTPFTHYVVSVQRFSENRISPSGNREERNTISFDIAAGNNKVINVAFTPTAITSYNGNIVISHNAGANTNIAVTGAGIAAPVPDINVTPIAINKTMETNHTGTENLQISNTGNANLSYTASVQYNSKYRDVIFSDGFESYTDFSLAFAPWTMHDGDGLVTYGSSDCDFTNEQYTGAYIIFNPYSTTPAVNGNPQFQTHTGNKYAACFNNTTAATPNNDWLITPQINLQSASQFSFWAKTVKDTWGLEQFKVGISTTGTNTTDFTIISGANSISAPATWTQFTYNISAYDGMNVYLAIQMVSNDCFVLAIDDVSVTGTPITTENWLAVNGQPSVSGTIAAGNNNSITVNFDTDGLAEATYEATIVITSNDPDENPVNVNVALTVSTVSIEPAITVNLTQLTSEVSVGGTDSKTFTITNTGDAGSDLTYSISWQYSRDSEILSSANQDLPEYIWERLYTTGTRDDSWLTVSPISGSCLYNESDQISVGFDSDGLTAGTYSATISIANNATVNQTVNVTFNVVGNGLPVNPKAIAEFAPAQGVLIRYPFGIPMNLIASISQQTKVTTIVASSSQQTTVTGQYNSNGVNMANCDFIIAASDSYWTRDFGPFFIRESNQKISIVDYHYNRPRPNDNAIPQAVANHFSLDYYYMPITHTGGNYMSNGMGTSASTTIVYTENSSLSNAQVDGFMQTYMGIDNHMVVNDPNNTYIDHIDCWGKFLAPNKVMIRSVHTGHAQYSEIEATANYFASQTSPYGTPYQVYRVYTPNNEPYSNSIIINHRVYVPQMGTGNDSAAITAYQNAMPGYTILGFTGSWESTDAIHCRIKEISDIGMLYVEHVPLHGELAVGSYEINATVIPYSGSNLTSGYPRVYYRVNSGSWNYVTMSLVSGNQYFGYIPQQAAGSEISYYIQAQDGSGRTEYHPYIGAADAHVFTVETETQPAELVVNVSSIVKNMTTNQTGSEIIQLSNSGVGSINYSLSLSETRADNDRSIEGSYVICNATEFTPGETVTLTFTVFNASTDTEWLKDIYIDFPTGVTVNTATHFVGGTGGDMVWDNTTGNGAYLNWHGENSSGWGFIQGNESATATVNITISSSFTGQMTLSYQIDGDIYGALPHTVNGTMTLTPLVAPLAWVSLGSNSGTLAAFDSHTISLNFDSSDLAVGNYTCYLNISDGRAVTIIPISLHVIETPNYPAWEPVTYSNDRATLYATITINNSPATAGDMVGAFVGTECRGTATVQVNGRASFVLMEIEMAQTNEVVSFKVYDISNDVVYPADYSTTANPGDTIGDSENMIPINAITQTSAPDYIGRMIENGNVILFWEPLPGAITYRVYSSDNPHSGFTLDHSGDLNLTARGVTWTASIGSASRRFYYVTVIY
jgi:agmatine/peptidylarginine deiminase